ncbi:MAG TPA: hypothetical protein VGI40_05355 [Pirellulaceae bacterium]
MQFRLRTLLIVLALGPPLLAGLLITARSDIAYPDVVKEAQIRIALTRYRLRTLLIFVTIACMLCSYVRCYQTRKLAELHLDIHDLPVEIHSYTSQWEAVFFNPARKVEGWWYGRRTYPLVLSGPFYGTKEFDEMMAKP